jgi:phosphoribosyl 1,2-cyclic phosphodiesterase
VVGFRFCILGSGSTGNATLIEAGRTRLLLDAGLGPRVLAERLQSVGVDPASLAAVVLSHEHNDHVRGALPFARKWGVPLSGTRGTYAAAGLGAEDLPGYVLLRPEKPHHFGSLQLDCVPMPHDAAGPAAFVVSSNGSSLGHATDLGHVSPALAQAFRACRVVLIESNYDPNLLRDGPYPWSLKERILGPRGHLSNDDTARYLAEELGEACRGVVLAHLSQQNNHPELALMSAETALGRRGRTEVRLRVAGPAGMGWLEVAPPEPEPERPTQLPLF